MEKPDLRSIAVRGLFALSAAVPLSAGAAFEFDGGCTFDSGIHGGSALSCAGQHGLVQVPGSFGGGEAYVFPGDGFDLPSSSSATWSGTYDYGAIRAGGTATAHASALPPGDTGPGAEGGAGTAASVWVYDTVTAFDPALPVGTALTLEYVMPLAATGGNTTSGGGFATAAFGLGGQWFFNTLYQSYSHVVSDPVGQFATTLLGSFVVDNGVAFDIQWQFGAGATTFVGSDAQRPGEADAASTVDALGRLFFGTRDAGVVLTADSGHDYRVAAAIPEPTLPALFVIAAIAAGAVRRRRRPAGGRRGHLSPGRSRVARVVRP